MVKTRLSRGSKILLAVTGGLLVLVLWSLFVQSPESRRVLEEALPQPPAVWSSLPPPQPAEVAGFAVDIALDPAGAVTPLSPATFAALAALERPLLIRLLPNQAASARPERDAQALTAWLRGLGLSRDPAVEIWVLAYDWPLLEALGRRDPDLTLAFGSLSETVGRDRPGASSWLGGRDLVAVEGSLPALVRQAGGRVWAPTLRELRPEDVADARAAGIATLVTDVSDPSVFESLLPLRPEGLITSRPAALLEAIVAQSGLYAPGATTK
ncbi:MAG: hypothetical protein Kilf2KO_19710 [Rhodospirillales bacterium]